MNQLIQAVNMLAIDESTLCEHGKLHGSIGVENIPAEFLGH